MAPIPKCVDEELQYAVEKHALLCVSHLRTTVITRTKLDNECNSPSGSLLGGKTADRPLPWFARLSTHEACLDCNRPKARTQSPTSVIKPYRNDSTDSHCIRDWLLRPTGFCVMTCRDRSAVSSSFAGLRPRRPWLRPAPSSSLIRLVPFVTSRAGADLPFPSQPNPTHLLSPSVSLSELPLLLLPPSSRPPLPLCFLYYHYHITSYTDSPSPTTLILPLSLTSTPSPFYFSSVVYSPASDFDPRSRRHP